MKNMVIIAACALLTCACGNRTTKNVVTEGGIVEREEVDIQDSLKHVEGLGEISEYIYKGPKPASAAPGEHYTLKLYRQQFADEGVFDFTQTFLDAKDGLDQSYHTFGKWFTVRGCQADSTATVFRLEPYNGSAGMEFLQADEELRLLGQTPEQGYSLTLE